MISKVAGPSLLAANTKLGKTKATRKIGNFENILVKKFINAPVKIDI
jgi:hypothetical protein